MSEKPISKAEENRRRAILIDQLHRSGIPAAVKLTRRATELAARAALTEDDLVSHETPFVRHNADNVSQVGNNDD